MLPVLSREVVEGKQRVAILDQALDSLVVFDAPGFGEGVERGECILLGLGHPDLLERTLGLRLLALGQLVQDIGGLVHPTALAACPRPHLLDRLPEAEGAALGSPGPRRRLLHRGWPSPGYPPGAAPDLAPTRSGASRAHSDRASRWDALAHCSKHRMAQALADRPADSASSSIRRFRFAGSVERVEGLLQPFLRRFSGVNRTACLFGGASRRLFRFTHRCCITMRLIVEGCLPFAGGIIGVAGELDRPNPDQVLIEILLLARSGSSA